MVAQLTTDVRLRSVPHVDGGDHTTPPADVGGISRRVTESRLDTTGQATPIDRRITPKSSLAVTCYGCIVTHMNKRRPATPKQAATCCAPIDELLDPELFKALCDPTRAKLIGCLAKCGRPCSVTEVAECCSVDFSVVSRHLAILARAGVLESAKEGRTVHYCVRFDELVTTLRELADAIDACHPNQTAGRCGGSVRVR